MIHPDELALRADCRAKPNDDLPRLVYADWLEERGRSELADLIRVQCQMRQIGEPSYKTIRAIGPSDMADYSGGRCVNCRSFERCEYHRLWEVEQDRIGLIEVEFRHIVRTRRQVENARRSVVGCCSRHADNMACDCLNRAVDLTWDRGFAVVRCHLVKWVGERCPHCPDRSGYQHRLYPGGWEKCGPCSGTGEIVGSGIGIAIAHSVPVGRVEHHDRAELTNLVSAAAIRWAEMTTTTVSARFLDQHGA